MVGDPIHMRKHRNDFLESLTPEEMAIHNDPKNQEAFDHAINTMNEAKKNKEEGGKE